MPIRFRCPFCNQRLGIGSRKAGTVVSCPTCHGQVTVPRPQDQPAGAAGQQHAPALFERSDFAGLFEPSAPAEPSPVATAEPGSEPFAALGFPVIPQAKQPTTGYDVEPLSPAALPQALPTSTAPGILLTARQATLLTIGVTLALGLVFGVGLVVGYLWGH
jgi:hypothetical protein